MLAFGGLAQMNENKIIAEACAEVLRSLIMTREWLAPLAGWDVSLPCGVFDLLEQSIWCGDWSDLSSTTTVVRYII